jgi:nucleoside-diphosphate-sugar epimerase
VTSAVLVTGGAGFIGSALVRWPVLHAGPTAAIVGPRAGSAHLASLGEATDHARRRVVPAGAPRSVRG